MNIVVRCIRNVFITLVQVSSQTAAAAVTTTTIIIIRRRGGGVGTVVTAGGRGLIATGGLGLIDTTEGRVTFSRSVVDHEIIQ